MYVKWQVMCCWFYRSC